MKLYKLTFEDNKVQSCAEDFKKPAVEGVYEYELTEGKLSSARVRARDEAAALQVADLIIRECNRRHG